MTEEQKEAMKKEFIAAHENLLGCVHENVEGLNPIQVAQVCKVITSLTLSIEKLPEEAIDLAESFYDSIIQELKQETT